MQVHRISIEEQNLIKSYGKDYQDLLPNTVSVQRLFEEDSRVKKYTGARHVLSKRRGFEGTVTTPTTFMNKSEIKKMNGRIHYYNLFSNIENLPSFRTFDMYEEHLKQSTLKGFIDRFSIKEVSDRWHKPEEYVIALVRQFNVELTKDRVFEIIEFLKGVNKMPEDVLMPWSEFMTIPRPDRKETFFKLFNAFGKTEMTKTWGTKQYYNAISSLKIVDQVREPIRKSPKKVVKKATVVDVAVAVDKVFKVTKDKVISSYGITDVKMDGEELIRRLEGLTHTTLDSKRYIITISIKEIEESRPEGIFEEN